VTSPPAGTAGATAVRAYLDRLREALPPSRADEVVTEVESLVEDRLEAEGEARSTPEAAARALAALGPPEALAAALAGEAPLVVPAATRRAFTRMLAVLFAGHLLLSIVLTAISADASFLPGIVTPLPRGSWLATAGGVLGVFLLDAGLLGVVFAVVGRERAPGLLPHLALSMPGTRRDAALSLVLIALVAVLLNVPTVRDRVFAVTGADGPVPVLSDTAKGLVVAADVVLFLFALRHLALLVTGRERLQALLFDALASLAGAALAVLVLTRDELVRIPSSATLSMDQAKVFSDLLYRVVLVIALVAGLLLMTRFVRRALRIRDLLVA
jgi:hypothetical protein